MYAQVIERVFHIPRLGGCVFKHLPRQCGYTASRYRSVQRIKLGFCGTILITRPLYDVTFIHPTGGAISDGQLYILPDKTRDAAGYVVQEWAWLGRVNLSQSPNTSIVLPVGP